MNTIVFVQKLYIMLQKHRIKRFVLGDTFLMFQAQAVSGDSSIDDSMTETTPPQNFAGVSPASLKVLFYLHILDLILIPTAEAE